MWQNLAVIGEQTEDRMMITAVECSVAFFLQAAPLAAYPLVDAPYKDDTEACVRAFFTGAGLSVGAHGRLAFVGKLVVSASVDAQRFS